VSPLRALTRRPGTLLSPSSQSPGQRYDAVKVDILAYHRRAVERTWEWLAAKAIIDGKVIIKGKDMPDRLVDFGRDLGHTIVLDPGSRWGEVGISILDDIQEWSDMMHGASFGGAPTRLTIGTDVWAKMRKDPEILAEMDITRRGNTELTIQTGLLKSGEVRYAGSLGAGIEVYVYNDYYTEGSTTVPFMSPKDIVLTGPNVQGYRCFGAIVDLHAQFEALPIFPRNYIVEGDVALEQILTQSAPLMVPVNPNATLKARVVG
jgi:hypothetical protein